MRLVRIAGLRRQGRKTCLPVRPCQGQQALKAQHALQRLGAVAKLRVAQAAQAALGHVQLRAHRGQHTGFVPPGCSRHIEQLHGLPVELRGVAAHLHQSMDEHGLPCTRLCIVDAMHPLPHARPQQIAQFHRLPHDLVHGQAQPGAGRTGAEARPPYLGPRHERGPRSHPVRPHGQQPPAFADDVHAAIGHHEKTAGIVRGHGAAPQALEVRLQGGRRGVFAVGSGRRRLARGHGLQTPSGRSAFFSVRSTKLDWLWRMPLIL